MTKEALLQELRHETYAALQPSGIHGIGVFAIRDIPKGCRNIFSKDTGEWIELTLPEVDALPAHAKNFIETYYLYDEDKYFIPAHGCKIMDMANYLNHSANPNLISINEGVFFEATRDIAKGDELLIDYGKIVGGVNY
jgi:SET domain-containing protein